MVLRGTQFVWQFMTFRYAICTQLMTYRKYYPTMKAFNSHCKATTHYL